MKRIAMTVWLPKKLHDNLKIAAIRRSVTMKDYVTSILTAGIIKEKPSKKQTPAAAFGGDA